ncbi:hypothetical protein [Streptomyces hokutonensis]|uniref:Uncharacterized protein n=1 Tax=Streptomyces hokutonensis TaxID=1306990 RepID=A0ABW6MA92_9ACTN
MNSSADDDIRAVVDALQRRTAARGERVRALDSVLHLPPDWTTRTA